jgi:hypothetical protein
MDIFVYALKQYSVLALMGVSFWGAGDLSIRALTKNRIEDGWLSMALSVSMGLGIFIVLLQALGAVGLLQRSYINVVLFSGLFLAAWQIRRLMARIDVWPKYRFNPWVLLATLLVMFTVFRPLSIPLAWDELMYHLPHASQWAQSGHLSVNEWLRYPWFPYNFDLLYSAALILRNDSFAHLLHALAGWLTMLMIYRLGVRHGNHLVAFMASCIWIYLSKWFFSTAYIEMGIALFVFASCVSFQQWLNRKEDDGWLLIACSLFGVAAGSKYQALSFLPLFFVAAVWQGARPKLLLKASFFFLLPCIYWYARNYILTGDPFNPLGGKLFGYSDWDAGDMAYQLLDLHRLKNWPDPVLWPALLSPVFLLFNKNRALLHGVVFSIYAVIIWYVTSQYDRYLMPAYPIIAILAAYSIWSVARLLVKLAPVYLKSNCHLLKYPTFLVLAISLGSVIKKEYKKERHFIGMDSKTKEEIRNRFIPEMGMLDYLMKNPQGKIYQWGLEGVIYYSPNPIWGDHFGFWRYRDFVSYNPEVMAQKLKSGGFDVLLTGSLTAQGLEGTANFKQYFQEIAASPGAKAYKIIP